MILYPAIDILGGQAVRLVQGRFEDATTYHDDPLEAAQSWVDAGARYLHVVDLDGAKDGRAAVDRAPAPDRARAPACRSSTAAGCARVDAVRDALRAGAERAIVGTAAFRDVDFLDEILAHVRAAHRRVRRRARRLHLHRGLDADHRDARPTDAIRRLQDRGVRSFVYTNVDRDGKLEGPDLDEVQRVAEAVRGRFLYSGGIGRREDLRDARRRCGRSTSPA